MGCTLLVRSSALRDLSSVILMSCGWIEREKRGRERKGKRRGERKGERRVGQRKPRALSLMRRVRKQAELCARCCVFVSRVGIRKRFDEVDVVGRLCSTTRIIWLALRSAAPLVAFFYLTCCHLGREVRHNLYLIFLFALQPSSLLGC